MKHAQRWNNFNPIPLVIVILQKEARLIAITTGWKNAKALENTNVMDDIKRESLVISPANIDFIVEFTRDNNLYYVNDQNELFWFDNKGCHCIGNF